MLQVSCPVPGENEFRVELKILAIDVEVYSKASGPSHFTATI